MSNIKSVYLSGTMTYNAAPLQRAGSDRLSFEEETERQDELLRILGLLSLPGIGLKVEWVSNPKLPGIRNTHGGVTAMVGYRIVGSEAFSYKWFDRFVALLKGAGTVEVERIEEPEFA